MSSVSISAVWHGTADERPDLELALGRYCTCAFDVLGRQLVSTCARHEMLWSDQRAMDGLLFLRRIAARLRDEEFRQQSSSTEVRR
jgi:hypothetical protein